MYFEIWDVVTRNLLYDFDTIDEALDVVQELAVANPESGRVNLALGQVDETHRTTWLARGDALLDMVKQRPAV
jgi:hypothetical protein